MIQLGYNKRNTSKLHEDLTNIVNVKTSQNFIPIYTRYFSLNPNNYNQIELNNKTSIQEIKERKNENTYLCSLTNNKEKCLFFKFSPLVDPIKYLTGKFDLQDTNLTTLPELNLDHDSNDSNDSNEDISCNFKPIGPVVNDANNIPYIDGFFSFLSSKLSEETNFLHATEYYGSYLAIKNNFKFNVYDDLGYICESDFFKSNNNIIYTVEDEELKQHINRYSSSKNLKKINIRETDDVEIEFDEIDGETQDNANQCEETQMDVVFSKSDKPSTASNSQATSSGSSCSSRSSNTNSNDETESESEDEDQDEDDGTGSDTSSVSSDEETLILNINEFPVQVICTEKCDNTLDNYMVNGDIEDNEWKSILFQVIATLLTYNKVFKFTHNDLHTNNIMYTETKKEFLYYCYNNTYYKVPTFGKIYKIIDFGRSIYSYKGNLVCSNSYASYGDAVTQYNCEPYLNSKKPRIEPNESFDLCRLGCSLLDYFIEDYVEYYSDKQKSALLNLTEDEREYDVADLINDWCTDDNRKNILYKSNGVERYPDFKR